MQRVLIKVLILMAGRLRLAWLLLQIETLVSDGNGETIGASHIGPFNLWKVCRPNECGMFCHIEYDRGR